MDLTTENCRKEFLMLRRKLQKKLAKADITNRDELTIDGYNDICIEAKNGDPIAQDYLSYIFKKGLNDVIPVNYEKYMQWQILAGANGNQFSIEKMSLFLNYAFNEVMLAEDFDYIASRNELTKENFNYIVGRITCEAMVDGLDLDVDALLDEPLQHIEFSAPVMRVFDKARNYAIPKVLKYLRS